MASAADTALEKLSMIERPARLVIELGLVIFLALLAARLAWTVVAPVESVADFLWPFDQSQPRFAAYRMKRFPRKRFRMFQSVPYFQHGYRRKVLC